MNLKSIEQKLRETRDPVLSAITLAAFDAGNKIVHVTSGAEEKGDEYVGHHAIVTKADLISQDFILSSLHQSFPESYFIAEEKADKDAQYEECILTRRNYSDHLAKKVFGVDALDGSSGHHRGLYEWSVSIGAMNNYARSGAVYAPSVNGGLLVFGSKKGVYVAERNSVIPAAVAAPKKESNAYVLFGIDMAIDKHMNNYRHELSNRVRTTKDVGSCALGLALVAAGKVDALIQPTQRVWDWFGGLPLVEGAGGVVQFFRMGHHEIIPLHQPEPHDYNPDSKNLGFIAGNPLWVPALMNSLQKSYKSSVAREKWEKRLRFDKMFKY